MPPVVKISIAIVDQTNPRSGLVLENYTFLTPRAAVLRTNVYAGPKRPFLKESLTLKNQVFF
jgi:hypothetical protein